MPLRKKSRKRKFHGTKPWITEGLRISIDKKDELYHKSKRDPTFIKKYKEHSNLLKKLTKISKYEYDKERVAEYGNDKAKTWKFVNEITKRKRKSGQSIKNIINRTGEKITKPDEIADCFNEHFSSVGKKKRE